MPTEAEILDEIKFGMAVQALPYASPEDLSAAAKEHLDRTNASLRTLKRTGIVIRFVFFKGDVIQGKAFFRVLDDIEIRVAAISTGAVEYFYRLFPYLLARYDVLPSVGVATAEVNLPFRFPLTWRQCGISNLASKGILSNLQPRDPRRRDFAYLMAYAASEFLIAHEIGHCTNGHFGRALSFSETSGNDAIDSVIERHMLELDADAAAMVVILRKLVAHASNFSWRADRPSSRMPGLYPALVSLALLFRILSNAETAPLNLAEMLRGTHPYPAIRGHFARVLILSFLPKRDDWGMSADEILQLTSQSMMDAIKIAETITGKQESRTLWFFHPTDIIAGSTISGQYLNDLLFEWRRLRPILQPRAVVNLAPIDPNTLPRLR